MTTKIYLLEPGASPPPRPVNIGFRATALLACGAVLFSAIIFGGIVALLQAAKIGWLGVAGHNVRAHVVWTDPNASTTVAKTGHYRMTYAFDDPAEILASNGSSRSNDGSAPTVTVTVAVPNAQPGPSSERHTPAASLRLYKVGDPLIFRYVRLGGQALLMPWSQPPNEYVLVLLVMAGTLIGVGVIFLSRLAGWHKKRMRLLRDGMAVTGVIVQKRVDSLEAKFYVKYSYRPNSDPVLREREDQCTSIQWRSLNEGDPVTVLYDPKRTESVGLYRLLTDP